MLMRPPIEIEERRDEEDDERPLERPVLPAQRETHRSEQVEDHPGHGPDAGEDRPVEGERIGPGADERDRPGDVVAGAVAVARCFARLVPGRACAAIAK